MEARDAPDVQSPESPDFRPRLRRWIEWADARLGRPAHGYWLTRFALLRALGFIYFIAFLSATQQLVPLIGVHGVTPAGDYLAHLSAAGHGSSDVPTLFWLTSSDTALLVVAWLGTALSLAVLCGVTNAPVMAALWILYTSIVNVGQVWYGYGWELMVLEAGFLAIFLCPLGGLRPLPQRMPPSRVVMWLYRWMVFRVMFGAGLIKLRGDACWRELTCLDYHYETQPVPSPLSWYWHHAPEWVLRAGVAGNHVVELIVPWLIFGPRRVRHVAAVILISFQVLLILSGNLSFLNWLTIAICLACFDDGALGRLFPRRVRERVARLHRRVRPSPAQRLTVLGLAAVVAVLSIQPALNLLSSNQSMNRAYDRFSVVNTYGAFGSVGDARYQAIIQGTDDSSPDGAHWKSYVLPCQPGPVDRRPCLITPYHLRLDWQIWFAGQSTLRRNPWLASLVYQLLRGDDDVTGLFAVDPFPDRPPRFVRVVRYRYRFTDPGQPGWWVREPAGEIMRPVSADDPGLLDFLRDYDLPVGD